MLSSNQIKEKLINDNEILLKILEENFTNVKIYGDEIRMSFDEESNPNGTVVYLSNLYARYFSANLVGDIYVLLQKKRNQSFKEVHKYLNTFFGEEDDGVPIVKKELFGGFFKKYIGIQYEDDVKYSEDDVKKYVKRTNKMFLDDNINIETQILFDCRYDFESHYIIILWKDECGDIRGVRGRRNFDDENKPKYMTFKSFRKNNFLFGLDKTLPHILKKRSVLIFESEKSTMKSWQFGYKNCVSVGSHCLSENQIRLLKYNCDNICLCYDKDVEEDILIEECKKIKRILPEVRVYYMLDGNNLLDKKDAPVDKDFETFKKLLRTIKEFRGDEYE